jgi:hypothetical protein
MAGLHISERPDIIAHITCSGLNARPVENQMINVVRKQKIQNIACVRINRTQRFGLRVFVEGRFS